MVGCIRFNYLYILWLFLYQTQLGWFRLSTILSNSKFDGSHIIFWLFRSKAISKKAKTFQPLRLANWPQSFSTYHTISPTVNSGYQLNKNGNVLNWPHKTEKKNRTRKNTLRTENERILLERNDLKNGLTLRMEWP